MRSLILSHCLPYHFTTLQLSPSPPPAHHHLQHIMKELGLMHPPLSLNFLHNLLSRQPPILFLPILLQSTLTHISTIPLNTKVEYLFTIVILTKVRRKTLGIVHSIIDRHGCIRRTPQLQILSDGIRYCSFRSIQQRFFVGNECTGERPPGNSRGGSFGGCFESEKDTFFELSVEGSDVARVVCFGFAGGGCEW